jgi:hypothetical protein
LRSIESAKIQRNTAFDEDKVQQARRIGAYGPIAKFAAYRAEFDDAERAMASELDWLITELRPEDDA